RLKGEPGDDAGERDAPRHVVVDADHMGAQALIQRGRAVGTEPARGRIIPVEVRHRSFLSVARMLTGAKGIGVQNPSAGCHKSSACRPPVEGTCDAIVSAGWFTESYLCGAGRQLVPRRRPWTHSRPGPPV